MLKYCDVRGLLIFILTFSVLSGCAKSPTEEMIRTEKAVDEARQKEAHL